MTLQQILEKVKKGQLSVEHAEDLLKKEGYEEMDYAKLDTTRKARTGFAEVVYCARKADEHLLNIYQKLYEEDGEVFGTRASEHQYELVKKVLPDVVYDPVSGISGVPSGIPMSIPLCGEPLYMPPKCCVMFCSHPGSSGAHRPCAFRLPGYVPEIVPNV